MNKKKLKIRCITLILIGLIIMPLIFAYSGDSSSSSCNQTEINLIKTDLLVLNQACKNISEQLDIYKNSSQFYQTLYEDKQVNVSNRELINIYNTLTIINTNISQLNQRIDNLENHYTLFSIEVGMSLLGLSAVEVILFEVVVRWWRNRKKKENGQNN